MMNLNMDLSKANAIWSRMFSRARKQLHKEDHVSDGMADTYMVAKRHLDLFIGRQTRRVGPKAKRHFRKTTAQPVQANLRPGW